MVGWSRRNSEYRARRKKFLANLTAEQREAFLVREAAFDKKITPYVIAFFLIPILICTACMILEWIGK
jgi:hypothetical protein